MFWKIDVLKKTAGLSHCQLHLWSQFFMYTCEEVHFLYKITNFIRKGTALQLWRIFITVSFETAISENAYWLVQYMYSYMWCVFRFDTTCFIKTNVKITCGRALFLDKLRKVPDRKIHHISVYIVLCNNICRVLTPWSSWGSSPILASNSKQIYLN